MPRPARAHAPSFKSTVGKKITADHPLIGIYTLGARPEDRLPSFGLDSLCLSVGSAGRNRWSRLPFILRL